MFDRPHPGKFIKEICLKPLKLNVTETAKALGVTRKHLSDLINGKVGITPEMAFRLSNAFNAKAETWLKMQANYDLWLIKKREKSIKVKPICKNNLSSSL